MGRKRHTPEQIITALREAEVGLARGKSVKLISRELGILAPPISLDSRLAKTAGPERKGRDGPEAEGEQGDRRS